MRPHFSPHFNLTLTVTLLVVVAVFLIASVIYRRRIMPTLSLFVLVGLRVLIFLVLSLFLLNPFFTIVTPDQRQFRIQFLYDSSGSMQTKDVGAGLTRLEKVAEFINSEFYARFSEKYHFLKQNGFSEVIHPWTNGLNVLPGFTMAGAVLNQLNNQGAKLPLGAVVLFSDGNSNKGPSLTDAAKKYHALGIPITTICLGSTSPVKDLLVRVSDQPLTAKLGEVLSIPVHLENSFDSDQKTTINCWQQGVLLSQQQVTIKANSKQSVIFDMTPTRAGAKVFRFTTSIPALDSRPENNTSYVMAQVTKSPITKILFIANAPTPQFKFLKRMVEKQKATKVSTAFRLSETLIVTDGEAHDLNTIKKEFPVKARFYTQFDVIISDAVVMNSHSKLFKDFMSERGGGLVILDNPERLTKENQSLIPTKSWRLQRNLASHSLKVADDRIFPEPTNEILYSTFGLTLLKYHHFTKFTSPFSYARTPLVLQEEGQVLALAQQYGGGRFVIMNYPKHWRWKLKVSPSDHYKSFWSGLISWLGSATKPRIDQLFNGQKLPLNQQTPLEMIVRDQRYEETSVATVSLSMTSPKGQVVDLALSPVMDELGQYQENFIAGEVGEYLVETVVKFNDEDSVLLKGSFLVVPASKEYTDVAARPVVLQDVARITKGDFYSSCPTELGPLKVGSRLPKLIVKKFWFDYLPLPLFLLILLLIDIYIRRRLGLK